MNQQLRRISLIAGILFLSFFFGCTTRPLQLDNSSQGMSSYRPPGQVQLPPQNFAPAQPLITPDFSQVYKSAPATFSPPVFNYPPLPAMAPPPLPAAPTVDKNKAFVDALYNNVLLRNPDIAGEQYWIGKLDSGVTPLDVAKGFEHSDENINNIVQKMYLDFLSRAGDAGGIQRWVGQIKSGDTLEDVMELFASSAEFLASHPDANSFITACYLIFLKRSPDAQGLADWVQRYSYMRPYDIAEAFTNCDEYRERLIAFDYEKFLGREPDAAGLQFWKTALQNGLSSLDVAAGIASSPEAMVRAAGE